MSLSDIGCAIITFVLFAALIGFVAWGIFEHGNVDIYAYEELLEPCQHEYVMSSKYNWFFRQYQIVSKCTKCGKVI
jgi:hypothetical protein